MRFTLTLLFTALCLTCFAQKAPAKVYKVITYLYPNDKPWRVTTDTIKEADVKEGYIAVIRHFATSITIPDSLYDPKHKGETVNILHGPPDNAKLHYTNSRTYDSLSRVISYSHSTCMVCNFMGYTYNVHYNTSGLIDEISGAENTISQLSKCNISYSANGEIKQIDYIEKGTMRKQITLM
jgi:hypothetical protein